MIVSVKADQATVAEGADGTFTVSLTGGAHSAGLVVNYAVGGSASADDYGDAASGTLTFAAERSKTITLNAEADSREEADETVTVTLSLSGQASNVSLGTPTAAAKITDRDILTASVARIPETVNEGADATFNVTLGPATSTADVVVEYKVEGAVTAADYSTPSGMLTIPMGASTGVITISTTDDNLPESAEDLTVRLTAATTAAGEVGIATGGGEMATTSIVASDGEILVSVRGGGTVNEGDDAVFTVELSGTLDSNLTVNFATRDGTAEAPGDYTAISNGALAIKAGERSAMITVSTATTPEDTRAENNETFMVTLRDTGLEAANVKIGTVGATATIRDDDPLTVNLSGPKSVEDGDPLKFTVELTGGTGSAVIRVTYQEGTNTGTATIIAGSPSDDIIAASTSDRAGETAVVNLTNVSTGAGTVRRGTSSASTRITHADIVIVSVADPAAVFEGDDIDFTVSRSTGTFTGDVVVRYATATGTAGSADFKALSDTLTISGSDDDDDVTVETKTVETKEDTRAENSETFGLTLWLVSPGDGSVELGDDRATATINDDDPLQAAVTRLQTTVLEGSDATFEVALTTGGASGSGSSAVVVSYSVVATVATTADYTEPSGKLTIRAGQSTGTIVIKTTSDNVLESDTALGLDAETLAVQLELDGATTSAGTVIAQGTSLATTIRDSDGTVVVSVADAAPVDEGQAAVFTVSLSGKVSQAVEVTASTTPSAGDDFADPQPATLFIDAGETTGTFTVQTTDDAVDPRAEPDETFPRAEADETFTLTLQPLPDTAPAGVVLGKNSATGTIRDNDPLRVNLSGPRAVAADRDATFKVELVGGTGSAGVEVEYTYTAGGTSVSTYVTIAQHTARNTFNVPSSAYDSGDTLVVTLTDVSTTGTVTRGTSQVSTEVAETTISVAKESVQEGEPLKFSVTASHVTNLVLTYSPVAGTARTPADYAAQGDTLTFPNGSGSIPDIVTESDTLNEGDETLTLRLSLVSPRPPRVRLATTATGTITDHTNDAITAAVIAGETTVTEGSPATFIVSLEGGTSTRAVVIDYTVGGDATAEDGDYTAPSGKLTISAGATAGTISIQTLDDGALDRGETLSVKLIDGSSAGKVSISDTDNEDEAETTIADASDGVTVSVKDTTVDEGETAMFTVELSGKVDADVTVNYTVAAGTATEGSGNDYEHPTETEVIITKGETTAMIPVETLDDMLAEASETFTLTLLPLPNTPAGVTLGDATATATITDDALTVTVVGQTEVPEGTDAIYTVSVTGGAGDEDVIVTYSTENSTATVGEDFSPGSDTVTIPAGDISATFTIQILPDGEVDLGEMLVLSVMAETADGDMVRAIPPAPTTILDGGSVQVSIEADPPVVAERQPATFTVKLSGTVSDVDVTLPYTIGAPTDRATADDYNPPPDQTVVIPAGETSQTISITLHADESDEPDETLSVRLQGDQLPEGVAIATGNGNGHDYGLRTYGKCDRTRVGRRRPVGHVYGRVDGGR